jgi:peroxiredoxin
MERKTLVEAAVARHGMRYRILFDGDGAVGRLYGAHAIPNVFVIDRNGVIEEHTYGAPALRK